MSEEAERQGIAARDYALQLLGKYLPSRNHRSKLVAVLQEWIEGDDDEEQKETGDYLIRALDEDRLSNRKLFPTELKGKTW
ncbi:MAG: hypothetical protein ACE5I1_15095 [bacterium]